MKYGTAVLNNDSFYSLKISRIECNIWNVYLQFCIGHLYRMAQNNTNSLRMPSAGLNFIGFCMSIRMLTAKRQMIKNINYVCSSESAI